MVNFMFCNTIKNVMQLKKKPHGGDGRTNSTHTGLPDKL